MPNMPIQASVLRNEDEVGLLPPVSGGCAGKSDAPNRGGYLNGNRTGQRAD